MAAGFASRMHLTEYLRPRETKQEKRLRVAEERRLSNSFIQLRCLQVKEDYQLSEQQKLQRLLGEYAGTYLTRNHVDKSVEFMHRSVHVTDDVNQFLKYKEEHPDDKGVCTFYHTTGLSSYRAMRWHTDGAVTCHDHMQAIENARKEFKSRNKMEPGQSIPLVMPCIVYMADLPAKNPKLGYSPFLTKCPQFIREKKALLKLLKQRIRDIQFATDSSKKRLSRRKYISDYYAPSPDLSISLTRRSRSQNASTLSASSSETSCGCIAESLLQDLEKGQQAGQGDKKQNDACSLDCSGTTVRTDEGTVRDQRNTATSLNTESNGKVFDTDDYVTSQIAEANLRSCIELLDSMLDLTLDPKEEGVSSSPSLYDDSLSGTSTKTTHVEADTKKYCDTCVFDKDEKSYRNLMLSLLKAVNLNIHRLLVDAEDELKNTPVNSMHSQSSNDQHSLLDSCPSSQHTTKRGSLRGSDRPFAPSSKKMAVSAEKDKSGTVGKIPMSSTNDASKILLDIMSYTLQGALQYMDTSTGEQDSEATQQLLLAAKNIVTDKRIVAALLDEVRKFIPQDDSEARRKEWEKRVMPLAKP